MATQREIDFASIRRVLVVKLRHHGDVLLSTPVFSALKGRHPHLEIDGLVYQDTAPMLSGHPALNNLYSIDRAWKRLPLREQLGHERDLIRQLRERDHDLLIHLTESWRGAILARLLRPRFSLVRRYASRGGYLWRSSFTHHYPAPGGNRRHTVDIHLDALRHIGLQPAPGDEDLAILPGEEAEASLQEKLPSPAPGFVVVHPTSRWLFKCWPQERVAETIDHLSASGRQVVITSAPDAREMDMVKRIRAQLRHPVTSLAGRLSLKELAALISKASLFIGVDSVPMHIASAVKTPTVVLFGPSGEIEWGPWRNRARVIHSTDHACRPCGQDGCGGSKISDCLTSIPSRRIIEAAEALLHE